MTSSCSPYASWLALSVLRDQTRTRNQNLIGQMIRTAQILMCRKMMKIHRDELRDEVLILDSVIFGKDRHSHQVDENQVFLKTFHTYRSVFHDLLATPWERIREQVAVYVHIHFLGLDDLVSTGHLEVVHLGNGYFLRTRNNIAQHILSIDWKRMKNHGDHVVIVDHVMSDTRLWMNNGNLTLKNDNHRHLPHSYSISFH